MCIKGRKSQRYTKQAKGRKVRKFPKLKDEQSMK